MFTRKGNQKINGGQCNYRNIFVMVNTFVIQRCSGNGWISCNGRRQKKLHVKPKRRRSKLAVEMMPSKNQI
jgi:hypothetical protein